MIVNCSYSSHETNPRMSPALLRAKMKECADNGCVRCRNGYYGNGPLPQMTLSQLSEMKEKLKDAPPINAKTLRALLLYTYADAQTHEGLTETEKGLVTKEEFETLMKWAFEKENT